MKTAPKLPQIIHFLFTIDKSSFNSSKSYKRPFISFLALFTIKIYRFIVFLAISVALCRSRVFQAFWEKFLHKQETSILGTINKKNNL